MSQTYAILALIASIISGTFLWLIARWGQQTGGDAAAMGFWISLSGACVAGIFLALGGYSFVLPSVMLAGFVFGIAHSIGMCCLIMYCLQIGPAGPTAVVNNMGMIFGVLYAVLWLEPTVPSLQIVFGFLLSCVAIVMICLGKDEAQPVEKTINPRWLKLVLIGGLFSGLNFMAQTFVGLRYPGFENGLLFLFTGYCVSAGMLGFIVKRRGTPLSGRIQVAGAIIGAMITLVMPLYLSALKVLRAEVAHPISMMVPCGLILLIGHFAFHERIKPVGLLGCLLGLSAVGILASG